MTVLTLASTPPANAFVSVSELSVAQPTYPLELEFCSECHHVQLAHVVDADHMFRDYVYVSGTSPTFVRHFEDYANSLTARAGLEAGDFIVMIVAIFSLQ